MRVMLFAWLCIAGTAKAQLSASLHDQWLRGKSWDDAVRAYNFSRPWQEDALPFLSHGANAQIGWYFAINKGQSLFIHPEAGYSRWQARTRNAGNELRVRMEAFALDAHVHINPRALFQRVIAGPLGTRWFIRLSPGITLWQAGIEERGAFRLEDELSGRRYRPRSLTPSVGLGTGYRAWLLAGQWVVTPRIGLRYTPRAVLTDFSRTLLGTSVFGIPDRVDHVMQVTLGMEFSWVIPKREKKS